MIMLGSNNYLGLTNHPKVKEAAIAAVKKYGTGCAGTRFLNGTLSIPVQLEEKLASFFRKDAALTFSTGYQTNLGIITSLAGKHDVVVMTSSTTPVSSTHAGYPMPRSESSGTTIWEALNTSSRNAGAAANS